ncbi:SAM-dependent methyltransferase [Rubricella aquisinus]|uniref:SAM-dependent methyltransferase n=1 Tax=Rubricella aquisinus TaxID=2028108 RepID=A0A840WMF6_9RHOB|nr:class I SAM-dependent methyltransferase [Rubricella aquisinus]MBB5514842.1 SAM-dependent methyltransferase [Rubricella aquisinus]
MTSPQPTPEEVFTDIYRNHRWGRWVKGERLYFSGAGSYLPEIVDPFVETIRRFTATQEKPLSITDIGCGDFQVGQRIRPLFGRYTACDVVPDLIRDNRPRYRDLEVIFRHLDITCSPAPIADVILVRQVFQHLSNAHIAQALANITGRCTHLIVADIRPKGKDWPVNRDMPTQTYTRMTDNSGLVLTEPPFCLRPVGHTTLSRIPCDTGWLETIHYRLR